MPRNKQLNNVIKSNHIQPSAVATADIADDAITNAKLHTRATKHLCFMYNLDELGGAASAITLTAPDNSAQTIPDNAVIKSVTIEGVTDNTSGGSATIALGYTGQATAFLSATAFDNAMWNENAVTTATPTVAVGKTTAAVSVLATIATAALTAGKWFIWVEYYEGAVV